MGAAPSSRHEVCHHDDDPLNNALANLKWGTRADNEADKIRNGNHSKNWTHCRRGHPFDEVNESHIVIMTRLALDNLVQLLLMIPLLTVAGARWVVALTALSNGAETGREPLGDGQAPWSRWSAPTRRGCPPRSAAAGSAAGTARASAAR